MSTINKSILAFILGLLATTTHISAAASTSTKSIVLSAPPRENPAQGMKIYGPIAAYLSKLLGVSVKYVHPGNWLKYQNEMRKDKYDILIDGPHFVAWRMDHFGHEPLVKLPGKLQFMLLADKFNNELGHADKLIGKNICGISPPHLSTLAVLDYYRNPVRQPVIKGIKGGMGKVLKSFSTKNSRCSAMVLRNKFFKKKVKKELREKLEVLYLSKAMPNQALTASKRISEDLKDKIKQALLVGNGAVSTKGFVKRFAPKAKSFIPIKTGEYDGYNMLLEGVIFGW